MVQIATFYGTVKLEDEPVRFLLNQSEGELWHLIVRHMTNHKFLTENAMHHLLTRRYARTSRLKLGILLTTTKSKVLQSMDCNIGLMHWQWAHFHGAGTITSVDSCHYNGGLNQC